MPNKWRKFWMVELSGLAGGLAVVALLSYLLNIEFTPGDWWTFPLLFMGFFAVMTSFRAWQLSREKP